MFRSSTYKNMLKMLNTLIYILRTCIICKRIFKIMCLDFSLHFASAVHVK